MQKPKITKTLGPIHFEDLEPHRFEDLVRELIYDFKDWQSIEATGRSGNDAGFDVRAYEKQDSNSQIKNEDDDQNEPSPMSGNMWMVQAKREKEIGPSQIRKIVSDIKVDEPPYGYILAASANFSKDSYDAFREELRKKGVTEFYLWGKAELEDMLHLPKNDHILFAFFGISLVSRRRSRSTEIRQVVINKNKLYRIFGDDQDFFKSVLLRDSKDSHYPSEAKYKDFKEFPRWQEYRAIEQYPTGLIVSQLRHFAFVDTERREFDYIEEINLIHLQGDVEEEPEENRKKHSNRNKLESFWERLPQRNQATFVKNGLIRYSDMLVIDEKGDAWRKYPHIFVDFDSKNGPIGGSREFLEIGKHPLSLDNYKRIKKFPKAFPEPKIGKLHKEKEIKLKNHFLHRLESGFEDFFALYETDGRYSYLKVGDAVAVPRPEGNRSNESNYIEITYIESMALADYQLKYPFKSSEIEDQMDRKLDKREKLNIYEFRRTWASKYEPRGNANVPGVI